MVSFSNILIFTSNAMNLCSMLTTNQLNMRILNTIANIFLILYGYMYISAEQMLNFVCWRILFLLIQIYQINKLFTNHKTNKNK